MAGSDIETNGPDDWSPRSKTKPVSFEELSFHFRLTAEAELALAESDEGAFGFEAQDSVEKTSDEKTRERQSRAPLRFFMNVLPQVPKISLAELWVAEDVSSETRVV